MENPDPTPGSFRDYALDERRTDRYTFTSLKGLMKYFRAWMEKDEIQEVIDGAKKGFQARSGVSREVTELQFIKKCEYILVRLLRNGR